MAGASLWSAFAGEGHARPMTDGLAAYPAGGLPSFRWPGVGAQKACLAAVIVAAAIGIIDPAAWRGLARVARSEVVIAAVTCGGVLVLGVLGALLLAVPRSQPPSLGARSLSLPLGSRRTCASCSTQRGSPIGSAQRACSPTVHAAVEWCEHRQQEAR